MADIPANGRKVVFDMRVTLGNVFTIICGCFVAAGLIYKAGTLEATVNARFDSLRTDVAQIKCDLAAANIGTSIGPCAFREVNRGH